MRAWIKIFFGPQPAVEREAWVFLGRSADGREAVVTMAQDLAIREVWASFAHDPFEEQAVFDALEAELDRITAEAADAVESASG